MGDLGSRTTAPPGIESFGDGKRSWSHYAHHLEDRVVAAEEALRQLRRAVLEGHYGVARTLAAVPEENQP